MYDFFIIFLRLYDERLIDTKTKLIPEKLNYEHFNIMYG